MYMTIHETNRKNGKLTEVTSGGVVLKSKRGNIIYYFYLYN